MPMFMLNGNQYGGNGGNYQVARMSKADYDALTDAQKNDGTLRIVVDSAGNSVNYMSAQVAGAKTDDTLTNLLDTVIKTPVTINGVTCTPNGDGTFIVNGTASAETTFNIITWGAEGNRYLLADGVDKLRLVGCPEGGSSTTYKIQAFDVNSSGSWFEDYGNGVTFDTVDGKFTAGVVRIDIKSGTPCDNLVFKPMLTTDLQATYDDFVGYTGGTGRLNSDVAEHQKEISRINSDLTDKMPKDAIKYHYQNNIHTDGGGLFILDAIQDYVPIASFVIFPTTSAQRHVDINYNPANGAYYGQTSANLAIEVTTIYLKYMP